MAEVEAGDAVRRGRADGTDDRNGEPGELGNGDTLFVAAAEIVVMAPVLGRHFLVLGSLTRDVSIAGKAHSRRLADVYAAHGFAGRGAFVPATTATSLFPSHEGLLFPA